MGWIVASQSSKTYKLVRFGGLALMVLISIYVLLWDDLSVHEYSMADALTLPQRSTPNLKAKLLVLVIANEEPVYGMNWDVWRRLQREHPQVQVYMLLADPLLPEHSSVYVDENSQIIYVRMEETAVPGILIKTVRALEVLMQDGARTFSHVLRTNLSSMWHWDRLMAIITHLDRLSDGQDYAAGNMNYHEPHLTPVFLSGSGILMTRGIGELLTRNMDQLRYDIIDDVAIGIFLELHNVRRFHLERCDFEDNVLVSPLDVNQSCFHYRVKNPGDRMHYDGYILSRLFFELYGSNAPA